MNWYAIRTLTDREFEVQRTISAAGFRSECPVAIEQRSRKRGGALVYTEIARPMFYGYVFAFMHRSRLHEFREDRHIYWPLPSWLDPREIPDSQVEAALSLSGIKLGEWKQLQTFKPGDIVRRKDDRSGLSFEVTQATADRIIALTEFLGRRHRVEFKPDMLEAAE